MGRAGESYSVPGLVVWEDPIPAAFPRSGRQTALLAPISSG